MPRDAHVYKAGKNDYRVRVRTEGRGRTRYRDVGGVFITRAFAVVYLVKLKRTAAPRAAGA